MQFEAVTEAVAVLRQANFHLVREEVHEQHFGDAEIELKRNRVVMRIVRERDRYFVELRPKYDEAEWFDLALVLRLLNAPQLQPHRVDVAAVTVAVSHLVNMFASIDDAFSRKNWRDTVIELRQLREHRWQERLSSHLPE